MHRMALAAMLSSIALVGPALAQDKPAGQASSAPQATEVASAVMMDSDGQMMGTVALTGSAHGVLVRTDLTRVAPGVHAFHIHETGKCEGPDFKSAGGHYDPGNREHGFLSPKGQHAGDLPNIFVGPSQTLSNEIFAWQVSLDPNAENTLFDTDGSSLVIHAKPDDYRTDPAGDAGNRIACGVIRRTAGGKQQ